MLEDQQWRPRAPANARVSVDIEEEATGVAFRETATGIAFGLWRDRDDLADVDAYLRRLRARDLRIPTPKD